MEYNNLVEDASCVVIIYDDEGKILLQHRDNAAPTAPNKWSFFGGGMESGEIPVQTAIREIKEELEYDALSPRLVLVRDLQDHPDFSKEFVFVEKYSGAKLTLREGDDMGFFAFNETFDLDMVENKKVLLPVLFDYINYLMRNNR